MGSVSVAECDNLEMTDETVATKNGIPSHSHSERGVSRNAVAVCMHQRSDIELGWSECNKYPEIDIFTGYSGILDVTGLGDNKQHIRFFNFFCEWYDSSYERAEGLFPWSILGQWNTVKVNEMRKFLAIIIQISICKRMQIRDSGQKNPVISCNFWPNIMNWEIHINTCTFHVNYSSLAIQKGNPDRNPLHKVRPLLEIVCIKYQNVYHQENFTVDEGMCKFKGQ